MESSAQEWQGRHLGRRTASWTEKDAILFALAVGARADELDLVFEDRLRAMPTFALTMAQWAPDLLGAQGAFEVGRALHGAQRLEVREPLSASGELEMEAEVVAVWDKGGAAVYDVQVSSSAFVATWSLFAPGRGGFGGERGPGRAPEPTLPADWTTSVATAPTQAALYRLLGDRHHLHVDPEAARRAGQPRPILHGLATLSTAALAVARTLSAHPAELSSITARFTDVVFPGDMIEVSGWSDGAFSVSDGGRRVLDSGFVSFG